jgi:hypothetical protein
MYGTYLPAKPIRKEKRRRRIKSIGFEWTFSEPLRGTPLNSFAKLECTLNDLLRGTPLNSCGSSVRSTSGGYPLELATCSWRDTARTPGASRCSTYERLPFVIARLLVCHRFMECIDDSDGLLF